MHEISQGLVIRNITACVCQKAFKGKLLKGIFLKHGFYALSQNIFKVNP